MIKVLLDQGLPRSTVQYLRELNIDAVHVGEIDATTAETRRFSKLAGVRVVLSLRWMPISTPSLQSISCSFHL